MGGPETWDYSNIISADVQESLLIKAAHGELFDNSLQINARAIMETNNKINSDKLKDFNGRDKKPIGYCKTHNCKVQHPINIIHSADFGPHVLYHCLKCLSKLICVSREESTGPFVLVLFRRPAKENNSINNINLTHDLEIKINKNNIFLNGIEIDSIWEPLSTDENAKYIGDNYAKWKLVVVSKNLVRNNVLNGYYRGYIKGRHFCKNIYTDNLCLSTLADYTPRGFMSKSIPRGVPGWRENHNPGNEGRLITYEYCFECAFRIKTNEIDYKKEYYEIQRKIAELEMHSKEDADFKTWAISEIEMQQKEIASLKNSVAEYKANEIKYRLKLFFLGQI